MKRLAVVFGIMCIGVLLLLSEKDKKQLSAEGKKLKKKFKKSHFPGKDLVSAD